MAVVIGDQDELFLLFQEFGIRKFHADKNLQEVSDDVRIGRYQDVFFHFNKPNNTLNGRKLALCKSANRFCLKFLRGRELRFQCLLLLNLF